MKVNPGGPGPGRVRWFGPAQPCLACALAVGAVTHQVAWAARQRGRGRGSARGRPGRGRSRRAGFARRVRVTTGRLGVTGGEPGGRARAPGGAAGAGILAQEQVQVARARSSSMPPPTLAAFSSRPGGIRHPPPAPARQLRPASAAFPNSAHRSTRANPPRLRRFRASVRGGPITARAICGAQAAGGQPPGPVQHEPGRRPGPGRVAAGRAAIIRALPRLTTPLRSARPGAGQVVPS